MSSWVVYLIILVVYFILTSKKKEQASNSEGKDNEAPPISEGNVINQKVENRGKTQTSMKEDYAKEKEERRIESSQGQAKTLETEGSGEKYRKTKKATPSDKPAKKRITKETSVTDLERYLKGHYSEESLVQQYQQTHSKGKTISHHGHAQNDDEKAYTKRPAHKKSNSLIRKLFKSHRDIQKSFLVKELLDRKEF